MRRAYTLTELLVVIIIMVILVAVSLSLVKRVMDSDRVRASSRQFSAYISKAKTQAAIAGRPAGLVLVLAAPLGTTDNPQPALVVRQCTQLYLAEVPPNYQGSVQSARGRIMPSSASLGSYELVILTPDPATAGSYIADTIEMAYLQSLIDDGDAFTVRFDHKGAWYRCHRTGGQFLYDGLTTMGTAVPVPPQMTASQHPGFAFTIQRAPVPVGDPMELTGGACIDLTYSGAGPSGNGFILHRQSLAIMFWPDGSIRALYPDGTGPVAPDGNLHFLMGRVSKMDLPLGPNLDHPSTMNMFDPNKSNLASADSLWVSINRANGQVTSSENTPDTDPTDFTPGGQAAFLSRARSVATGGQQMGGQ